VVDVSATPGGPADDADAALDRRPSRTGTALSLLAALVVVGALTPVAAGQLVAAIGLVALVVGLQSGAGRAVDAGATLLFVGVVIAGVFGAPPELLLVATAGTVVAWDVGENAVSLGHQLGRAAGTDRAEFVHAAASTGVAAAGAGLAYVAFVGVESGQPSIALVSLLFGAVLLATALR